MVGLVTRHGLQFSRGTSLYVSANARAFENAPSEIVQSEVSQEHKQEHTMEKIEDRLYSKERQKITILKVLEKT